MQDISSWPKNLFSFFSVGWLQKRLVVFNLIQNNFVRLYCDSCHIFVHLKRNLSKLVNFYLAILILKMEENAHFWHIMLYYFKKGKNASEMQKKKDFYNIWRRCCDLTNVSKVVCEVSCWRFLAVYCSMVRQTS